MKALLAQVNWRPSNRDLRIFPLAIACLMGMLTLIGRLRYGQMPEYGASALRAALAAVLLGLACPTSFAVEHIVRKLEHPCFAQPHDVLLQATEVSQFHRAVSDVPVTAAVAELRPSECPRHRHLDTLYATEGLATAICST